MPNRGSTDALRPRSKKRRSVYKIRNCLPCRKHKLRCGRQQPCLNCVRYAREGECHRPELISPLSGILVSPTPEDTSPAPMAPAPSMLEQRLLEYHERRLSMQSRNVGGFDNVSDGGSSGECSQGGLLQQGESPLRSSMLQAPIFVLGLPPSIVSPGLSGEADGQLLWQRYGVEQLPDRNQCDMLLSYYLEHCQWYYQTLHVPSFRRQYDDFWRNHHDASDTNFAWLSLLYSILAVASLNLPQYAQDLVGFAAKESRVRARSWFLLSRQALHTCGFEYKPTLTQLQTYLVTQAYLYDMTTMENRELLNSYGGYVSPYWP